MSGRNLLAVFFLMLVITTQAQQDTVEISFNNNIIDGTVINDYTNKWKVTYVDAQGNEVPNKIWTDYGQIIELDGKKYFHRVQDLYDPNMKLQDTWINMVEHETLIPVSFSTLSPTGGFLHYQFEGNQIKGKTNQLEEGEVTDIYISLDSEVYDWNLYGMLLVGLPIEEGFVAKLPFYSPRAEGSNWLIASVLEKEELTLPDRRTVQAYKIETNQQLTFWISKKAPYVIKLELSLQNNAKLVWETI